MSVELEEAIHDLAPGLLRYCAARTRDSALAEEIAQESLATLVQRWRRHGAPDSPRAFAFTVARRRASRALIRRSLWLPMELLAGKRHDGPDPEQSAISTSGRAALAKALRLLSARDREALLMVAVGGLGVAEAALVLGISPSALKMRTLRARRRLRAIVEDRHEAPGY